jgi:hypothetical protein
MIAGGASAGKEEMAGMMKTDRGGEEMRGDLPLRSRAET